VPETDEEWEGGNNTAKLFERSRIKALADERESVQKKTFAKWVNSHLARVGCKIEDLYVDLRDGKMLLKLLEVLSGERLPRPTKGRMRIHCLENVDKSLSFLTEMKVHLENLGAQDVVDGNPRLTLGLIWTIILRFQIQDITVSETDTSETRSAKDALLLWCQMKTAGYPNVNVRNFTTSWRDGLAFNALIHKHRPDLIDYNKLNKGSPDFNLNNAFNVADEKLGLARLLDPEDVNVDYPDEKSIITYVVTYYHYFSKMKADSVAGRRIGKVIKECQDNDKMIADYETLTSDLLEWIRQTIELLNDRHFANSLTGVKQQLTSFNNYRNTEKPPKFDERGNLEVLLFTIQSKMRANNIKPYTPSESKTIRDINKAWEKLEKAEHERELALYEELMRQEKLEQLAARFDRKAGMRETWLNENQRLVSQDNFGFDLAAVEAATKKHEAIETDILAYEERVQAVVTVANELEQENYHDFPRINARKDNVLRLWDYLLELLKARRLRLQLSLQLHKIFQEILYILDWMDEIKARLLSPDFGKHLMGVDDLLQKHGLLESDIRVIGDRVKAINAQASKFVDCDFPEVPGYKPVEPEVVKDRMRNLEAAYAELRKLSNQRRSKLDESRQMWQFFWDMAEEEAWMKEKEQLMSSPDLGRDLTSVLLLLQKHQAYEDELNAKHAQLLKALEAGQDLIKAGNTNSDRIEERIRDIQEKWTNLIELATYRKKRLLDSQAFQQFCADADDINTWMVDTLTQVSSEEVGHDEASAQALVKKHKELMDEMAHYKQNIDALHQQADSLADEERTSPEVQSRLATIDRRYKELEELANLRMQRLQDALSLYVVFNEADAVDQWINEKMKLLLSMQETDDSEELEIQKARFEAFDPELTATKARVDMVNDLTKQLIQNEHPDAHRAVERQEKLNDHWRELEELANKKRNALNLAHRISQWYIEAQETNTWIREKARIIQSTDELGNDLAGIIQLQRRVGGLERDISAIEDKLKTLRDEAERLEHEKPEEATEIKKKVDQLDELWVNLKEILKERDERLHQASELMTFLQNLDHFQQWLTNTQRAISAEDISSTLPEAEEVLAQHQQLKAEITGYAPEYAQMKVYGEKLVEGRDDVQYKMLGERLKGLDDGWRTVQQLWDEKQHLLGQSLDYQSFDRDALAAEKLLSQQDLFLATDEVPHSHEEVETMIRRTEAFLTSMDAHDDKINEVKTMANKLIDENHYASEKIRHRSDVIGERQQNNRQKALDRLEKLKDALQLQLFLQECDEHSDWLAEKILAAQDETYRDAKTIHTKFVRHQAFEAEVLANKDALYKLQKEGDDIKASKPAFATSIDPKLAELVRLWKELEDLLKSKSEKLFDANRHLLYEQSIDDVDNWMSQIEAQLVADEPTDLATVNLLMQKQNMLESELKAKEHQVDALQAQTAYLNDLEPGKQAELIDKKDKVQNKFQQMLGPLNDKRMQLEKLKKVKQFIRDLEDEKIWIDEHMPSASSTNYGKNMQELQMLQRKHRSLQQEVEAHQPHYQSVCDTGVELITSGHPQASEFEEKLGEVQDLWEKLQKELAYRQQRLEQAEVAQKYVLDAEEAEAWMGEQELYMMNDDRPKNEFGAENMINKHENLQKTIDDYEDTIRGLAERNRDLIDNNHPDSDLVSAKQAKVDKQYASLKDLASERKNKLDELLKLYLLNRDIEDLEQWIAEREVVAGSHELGQDFEHVVMLKDRFKDFAQETETVGQEKVAVVNKECDDLINAGHNDSATIAEWKDKINEMWTDLLELMDTRKQMLQASYLLHKFFTDCKETIDRIHEKEVAIPDDLGRDAQMVYTLQRMHNNFEHDLIALSAQVQQVQEDAAKLIVSYSGDKAREIQEKEAEVVAAWKHLQDLITNRSHQLRDSSDFYKFFSMARALTSWMDDITKEMTSGEKPKDVSGVELLMNNHNSLKAEIEARDENFTICANLGKELIARKLPRSPEVRDKLVQLAQQRGDMMELWEERYDKLQLMLEVYQFARDAAVAENWLASHESTVKSKDLGKNLADVEQMMKKQDDVEKSLATQEDRFGALNRQTTFEVREQQKAEEEAYLKANPNALPQKPSFRQKYLNDFLPPPEPEPKPVPKAAPVEAPISQVKTRTEEGAPKEEKSKKQSSKKRPQSAEREQAAAAAQGPDQGEGMLVRKHEWETTTKKASNRSWDKVYASLNPGYLAFYKDQKHAKADPSGYFHGEQPLDLAGSSLAVATDYTKKPNVFRLKLANGGEYLFQCHDSDEMNGWIDRISKATGGPSVEARTQTLPAATASSSLERKEDKKRGLFTLGKKK